ncbi:hypothetical protein CERSUDRAFT_76220 [Gelatoporia subvermispora B]|uniref:Uncharacterized protein n=1 Tax=Ceriporiopsis subvermispora (strain B) TaxID=914234 RepID=M2R6W4_CERS8|nr:hypothetical protein CERSUDRAFT_76220 [Gelatoporia subvermispora B]
MSLDTSVSTVAGATLLGERYVFGAVWRDSVCGSRLVNLMELRRLYGVISLQSFNYFSLSEKDPAFIRLTVAVLWGLNTLHQAFIMHMAYTYAIVDFGSDSHSDIKGIIAFIVRCLFLIRVMKLSGKNWYLMMPPLLSIVMSAGRLNKCYVLVSLAHEYMDDGCHLLLASTIVLSAQEVDLVNPTYWLVFVALGCDVVSDILLSSTLAVLLHNLKTGIRAYSGNFRVWCEHCYLDQYFLDCVLDHMLTSALLAGYNSREHLREAVNNAGEMISISIIFSDPHEPRQHAGTVALQPTNYGDKPNIR